MFFFKIPYKTLRRIFGPPIGFSESSTDKDIHERLVRRLKAVKVPELFCVLNHIFGVNFEYTELWMKLTDKQKEVATTRMLRQLCYAVIMVLYL